MLNHRPQFRHNCTGERLRAKVLTQLLEEREQQGRLGHSLWFVDATIVRARRAAGGSKKKSGRGPEPGRAQAGATQRAS
jgi:hypothetical protein